MASTAVAAALERIKSDVDKAGAYRRLVANITRVSDQMHLGADLIDIAKEVNNAGLSAASLRPILDAYCKVISDTSDPHITSDVGGFLLSHIIDVSPQSTATLVDQSTELRKVMAFMLETQDAFDEATAVLAGIPLDSTQRPRSDVFKAEIWIRIMRNYLEIDDSTSAEVYLNKVKNIVHNLSSDGEDSTVIAPLLVHFRLSQARINDAKREFLAAAQSYYAISTIQQIAAEEQLQSLSMAIKCAILAPAGPSRNQILGKLYSDDRSSGVEEYGMLEKIYLERLLTLAEVDHFAKDLAPHQLAVTGDGSTVLAKAIMEHNLLGVSKLYRNIGFSALGSLLGLTAEKAEDVSSRMIEQGRLVGRIDQIDQMIFFEGGEASGSKGSGRAMVLAGKEMRQWDKNVQRLAEELELVCDAMQREEPLFVARNLVV